MTDSEKLIELLRPWLSHLSLCAAKDLISKGVTVLPEPRQLEEWGEDYGDVLWWKFPIEEPPYVGSPLDLSWPGYHTHWTPIPLPLPPRGE